MEKDRAEGQRLRDEAMRQIEQNTTASWIAKAEMVIRDIIGRQEVMTSDDVWAAGLTGHHDRRALGPVMRRLHREGVIVPTDDFIMSSNPLRHGAPIRIWARA